MNQFSHYPYQNFSDYNLDWLMKLVKGVNEKLSEYLETSVISFADPINWNITEQYPALTCVIDSDGTAYISRKPVPAGIDISNTDYWSPIFNYNDSINALRENIAPNDGDSEFAAGDRERNTLVWIRGTLYKTLRKINAGDRYIIDGNVSQVTVSDMFNVTYSEPDELITFPNGQYLSTAEIGTSGDTHVYSPLNRAIVIKRG